MKPLATLLATLTLLVAPAMLHAQVRLEHKFPDGRTTTVNKYVKANQELEVLSIR